MSEHEGFGVPILEAMAAGLPVVAFAAAAVPETMGGAGILVRSKDPALVAATVQSCAVRPRAPPSAHRSPVRASHTGCSIRHSTTAPSNGRSCRRAGAATGDPDSGSVRDQLQPRGCEPEVGSRSRSNARLGCFGLRHRGTGGLPTGAGGSRRRTPTWPLSTSDRRSCPSRMSWSDRCTRRG